LSQFRIYYINFSVSRNIYNKLTRKVTHALTCREVEVFVRAFLTSALK